MKKHNRLFNITTAAIMLAKQLQYYRFFTPGVGRYLQYKFFNFKQHRQTAEDEQIV